MIDPPHVATEFFAKRFQELAGSVKVRMLDTDQVRKLTPLRIQRMLKEQAPDLPVSQTQIYRYFHGEAPPRLDVVYELARLFNVTPTYFVEGADEETPTVDARYESARSAHRDRAATIDPPHVATDYFATRFQALASSMNVRMLDTDRVRKLTPLRIQRMLKEQAPDLPVSQTQIYRYFHGEAPPRLDVVYELARLFGVPPTYFVPEEFLPEPE
ncbi:MULTISPECIES: helix-turn-helix transcriptional regulator [Mycobacterium]|uniref:helix-turn-helix transcriptional regulator n=1 Tax=Mycobacterium TaxID=1763 RepID=UPI001FC968F8|nr:MULTISPECIES: helix-turn-helix transcriptional regulator [Mycobacterium]